ncbi:phosphatase PAP2 family protein [Nocardioides sp. CER19]|uniref:phosphatase PAP2 family protein n=1 Tax=Nocardioides sp. CER19 TaxID=3038538 RepID=UPI00244B1F4F|nr:phosphatase PAP2 family protein [Nocardioides sp. CER19]MDH2415452.1 phosphatase PAP2 family protein [Nocardioides sp. CER19]
MSWTSDGTVVWGSLQKGWFESVNHLARTTPWLHAPARLYAVYGVGLFAGLLLLSWWLVRRDGDLRRMAAALWAPIGVLVAVGVNQFLVAGFAEPRPYTVLPHTLVLVARSSDYSFPSDHAVMAGAATAGVMLAHRRLGLITLLLALAMAFTRVYVGAHFPLDVVTGLLVGAAIAWLSYLVVAPVVTRLVAVLARTPLRPLLTSSPPAQPQPIQ